MQKNEEQCAVCELTSCRCNSNKGSQLRKGLLNDEWLEMNEKNQ